MKRRLLSLGVASLLLLIGVFFIGWKIGSVQNQNDSPIYNMATRGRLYRSGNYTYISPLLLCEISGDKEVAELQPIKQHIDSFIRGKKEDGTFTAASVYVRTMNSGRWINVNPDERFVPASLLKVALFISYLRWAEIDPTILPRSVLPEIAGADLFAQRTVTSGTSLRAGETYTIAQLLDRMIIHSSNDAMRVLWTILEKEHPLLLQEVYTDIDLAAPKDEHTGFMTTRAYAKLFIILYNATYLAKETSEAALQLLTSTAFTEGIVAGVPSGTPVAHKFGERAPARDAQGDATEAEFHDCGIVYYPGHPYLLCIMTKGNDFEKLKQAIAETSRLVYQEIDTFFKK